MSVLLLALLIVAPPEPDAAHLAPMGASTADLSDSLTVEECVAIARERAPAVLAAQHLQRAALGDSAAASLNRKPQLSLRSGATIAPKGFYDPALTNLGDYEVKAVADWTLADGGARARARARSGLGLTSSRLRAAVAVRDAGLRAAELALRLLRLQEAEVSAVRSLEWIEALGTLVRAGVASGSRGSADSIRVALERDAVDAALESTRLERRTVTLELRSLLGIDPEGELNVRTGHGSMEHPPDAADSLRLIRAVARQPEIALARIDEQQRRLDLEDAMRQNAMAFNVTLDAGLAGTDLTTTVPPDLRASNPDATLADRLRRDLGASAAFHLSLPIRDTALRHRVGARTAELEAASITARAGANEQHRLILALLAQWRSACRRLQSVEITYERAERNLLKVKSLYSAGATTLLDLLDARRVFEEARNSRAEARAGCRLAQFQVEGRL